MIDFKKRFHSLLAYEFRAFAPGLALSILDYKPHRPMAPPPLVVPRGKKNQQQEENKMKKKTSSNENEEEEEEEDDDNDEDEEMKDISSTANGEDNKHSSNGDPDKVTSDLMLVKQELEFTFTHYDTRRLEAYTNNLVDYHVIVDLMPAIARFYFLGKFSYKIPRGGAGADGDDSSSSNNSMINENGVVLSHLQAAILLALGLQHKTVDEVVAELTLQPNQVLAMFGKTMKRFAKFFRDLEEWEIEKTLPKKGSMDKTLGSLRPLKQGLDDELAKGAKDALSGLASQQAELIATLGKQYLIKGTDEEWEKELSKGRGKGFIKSVSIKRKQQQDEDGGGSGAGADEGGDEHRGKGGKGKKKGGAGKNKKHAGPAKKKFKK